MERKPRQFSKNSAASDVVFYKNEMQKGIVFGSCNRQDKPQLHWEQISSHLHPRLFLWLGDAVYAKSTKLAGLQKAFYSLLNNRFYSNFVKTTEIDGVWDDHDYGINDAGNHVIDRKERQKAYVDFLINSSSSSQTSSEFSQLFSHDGLYHSRNFAADHNINVKIIFLDTRSFRDIHYIRSLGEFDFIPGSAIMAAGIRAFYSVMGYGRSYNGAVLGDKQWKWFENELQQLRHESVGFTIVVSSIQLMTTNPVVESWGHFPLEKKKMFNILKENNVQNVVFLSGDVHMGEISSVNYKLSNGESSQWIEVTSSGLTHTCLSSKINTYLYEIMTNTFGAHRWKPSSLTFEKNVGSFFVTNEKSGDELVSQLSLHSVETNTSSPLVYVTIPIKSWDKTASIKITDYYDVDFPSLDGKYQFSLYFMIFSLIFFISYYLLNRKKRLMSMFNKYE
jgi:alkaline phosphatase D